mmetsp:Transcript_41212/g.96648  ORF Transcript_41212/g.96648 Transcript_41212/m.96648 type:complete len:258 (-) Transcript_41212:161-934(-)
MSVVSLGRFVFDNLHSIALSGIFFNISELEGSRDQGNSRRTRRIPCVFTSTTGVFPGNFIPIFVLSAAHRRSFQCIDTFGVHRSLDNSSRFFFRGHIVNPKYPGSLAQTLDDDGVAVHPRDDVGTDRLLMPQFDKRPHEFQPLGHEIYATPLRLPALRPPRLSRTELLEGADELAVLPVRSGGDDGFRSEEFADFDVLGHRHREGLAGRHVAVAFGGGEAGEVGGGEHQVPPVSRGTVVEQRKRYQIGTAAGDDEAL